MATPAIFLDRDGVIIENRANYVRDWSDVTFIGSAMEAMVTLARLSLPIIIVTNQSAVGRGIITKSVAEEINQQLVKAIEKFGGRVNAVFMCPHSPKDHCNCRKPEPGLLFQASRDLDITLSRSILVGDALTDIEAGRNAGVGRTALVLTGRGKAQLNLPEAASLKPFEVFSDLKALVEDDSFNY